MLMLHKRKAKLLLGISYLF